MLNASKRYNAVVIGGGPAGSATGLMLARAGWRVALVEKSRFPRPKVCGEFISASTFPLFAELGLLEDVLELAGPEVRRVAVFSRDDVSASAMPVGTGQFGKWGRARGRDAGADRPIEQVGQGAAPRPFRSADVEGRQWCGH